MRMMCDSHQYHSIFLTTLSRCRGVSASWQQESGACLLATTIGCRLLVGWDENVSFPDVITPFLHYSMDQSGKGLLHKSTGSLEVRVQY